MDGHALELARADVFFTRSKIEFGVLGATHDAARPQRDVQRSGCPVRVLA